MIAGRWRIEVVRFGLLLTLTVALISVATRIGHHDDGRAAAHRQASPPASAGATPPAPTGSSGAGTGSPAPGSGASSGPGGGDDGSAEEAGSGAGGSGPAGGVTAPTEQLPRTGTGQVVRLSATALLLIAAGTWSTAAGRRPRAS